MKVKIDLTYNPVYLVYDNGTPKSQHLMQWLSIHDGILEVDMPTIPLPGDRLDIVTENKSILPCRIGNRYFTAGVKPSKNEIQATIYAEVLNPENIQDNLVDYIETGHKIEIEDKEETTEDILRRDIITYLKNHESGILATRLRNVLKTLDIRTFADVCQYRRSELSRWRNFGRQTMDYLDDILASKGLRLGMDVAKYGIKPSPKIV